MNAPLLGIVALIYAAVAWDYFDKGDTGMGIAFIAYAVANFGFILAALRI